MGNRKCSLQTVTKEGNGSRKRQIERYVTGERLSQSFFSRLEVFSLKSSSQSVLLKKNFKKKFTKFTLKHLCRSLLNKILGLRQH